jgi:hypothetical protein
VRYFADQGNFALSMAKRTHMPLVRYLHLEIQPQPPEPAARRNSKKPLPETKLGDCFHRLPRGQSGGVVQSGGSHYAASHYPKPIINKQFKPGSNIRLNSLSDLAAVCSTRKGIYDANLSQVLMHLFVDVKLRAGHAPPTAERKKSQLEQRFADAKNLYFDGTGIFLEDFVIPNKSTDMTISVQQRYALLNRFARQFCQTDFNTNEKLIRICFLAVTDPQSLMLLRAADPKSKRQGLAQMLRLLDARWRLENLDYLFGTSEDHDLLLRPFDFSYGGIGRAQIDLHASCLKDFLLTLCKQMSSEPHFRLAEEFESLFETVFADPGFYEVLPLLKNPEQLFAGATPK